ncbi:5-hydroxytryptamine (serotonin) receptor 2C, G protein-coupled-like 1 [Esox lucius]|uniref:G-protein coupled receptors family 1 profile domain-containing protein n=1 Tax=Esox lucius TaxID=8010 RepID=A0A6Q2Z7A2_ESOLU|nr:5-hydroxytryptamine (serotonin) receptor 2C, G protein-coupled-like 1 [Esox lucius]XP_019899782.1 5-hydroxytryptamine (serotonin) receptor 2C, G protein-coupled-like 1 [Esox lucius]XP_034146578.1 5-hydroxytryptamine (serotonin) receptor 2C, G protein-coupled-like 1 [Esox lucius]XP_034146579.1 5-hydroxytryptamine (serotonin) receptor 2C, G protein-coupled-like 1 [Esox lucius]
MGAPGGVALLGGFGSSTTASLEVGGWMVWPGGNKSTYLGLNQSLPWGADSNLTSGSSQAEVVSRAAAMKEKNWPALLILVIIALTVGGNILVILAVSLEKKLQNATNFFLRSLAVADMLVGILVMPISLINILYDYAWPLPSALCPIWIYLDVLFSTASIMHLCAISLDRYVAIRNPIEHSRFNSRTKAMMKIAAVWTISIGVSTPIPVIGLHNKDKVFVNGSCVLNEQHFMLIGSFVAFFIPLVIMVVSYCLTIQVLQRQETVFLYEGKTSSQQPLQPPTTPLYQRPPPSNLQVPPINIEAPPPSRQGSLTCLKGVVPEQQTGLLSTSPSDSISLMPGSEMPSQLSSPSGRDPRDSHGRRGMMQAIKNERRASKVLGIVFFLFLIMWCPFFITNVTYVLCQGSCNEPLLAELLNVFVWVGYVSSGVNPLVYTLFNKTYRRAFSSYIRCQYNTGPNAAISNKSLAIPTIHCPSYAVTPILGHPGGNGKMGGVDRNSNCRNGRGGADGNGIIIVVEPEDTTDDGMAIEMECPRIMSELEPRMSELKLSVNSFRHGHLERTSSV